MKKSNAIRDALSHFQDFQYVVLGTIDGDSPRVRPVTLIYLDSKFWVMTDTNSEKVKHIRRNPRVEFCMVFTENDADCCLRVSGVSNIVTDKEAKAKIANYCDFFHKHWQSVNDPNYTLLEIHPTDIIFVSPNKTTRMNLNYFRTLS